MKAYPYLLWASLSLCLLSACQDDEGEQWGGESAPKISASFRLFEHSTGLSINTDTEREDAVESVVLAGAGTASAAGAVSTFQLPAYQGKRDLFFAANIEGAIASNAEFNTKRYDATPYVKFRGDAQLKLPMTATLRDVYCKTTNVGGTMHTELFQGNVPVGNATPVALTRVFARIDFDIEEVTECWNIAPNTKIELCNVPKYFQLGNPINNYDQLSDANKYITIDLTEVCKTKNGKFSVYVPEHYVSSPDFGIVDIATSKMTYLRIRLAEPMDVTSKPLYFLIASKKYAAPDFGQISRNKIYTMAFSMKEFTEQFLVVV